jgi:septal ring factor EnvC (AmiA/AmiB activator)
LTFRRKIGRPVVVARASLRTFIMTTKAGIEGVASKMNEQEFQSKLAELMGEITTLPATERKKLEKLAEDTRVRHERLRATVSSLQESLDYLRLSIKYLVFDLEATRRENGYLRKMLEETSGNNE